MERVLSIVVNVFAIIGGLYVFLDRLPKFWGWLTKSPKHLKPFYINREWERDNRIDEALHQRGQYVIGHSSGQRVAAAGRSRLHFTQKRTGRAVSVLACSTRDLRGQYTLRERPIRRLHRA